MNEIKLLDCTLRDGGYVNDWKFGHANLVSMLERLISSGTEIIEIGFLDDRREFDINRSIMPDTESVGKIYGKVDKKNAMILGMIDYGTCGIENLQLCSESYLDGIRVIFKKHLMHEAMAFCAQVKALGYKVFSQLVSITSYSDEELKELIKLVNEVKPYAVSIVDTYGLLHQEGLLHYFSLLNEYVLPEIGIGYHSHNNFQLAYANCIEYLKAEKKHDIVVDATLYGMGKSAGNAPIELVAMHLNSNYDKKYDINQMLEAIDGNIMQIYKKSPWGYNLFYYLSASNNCHPNYVQFLLDKHTLSMKSINKILDSIAEEKKLLYDKSHIEKLYYEYQKKECDDSEDVKRLIEALKGREILLIGPGKNIQAQETKVASYISEKSPVVISTNFIPGVFKVDFVFLSNTRRYIRLSDALTEYKNKDVQIIATSNVTNANGQFEYTLNNSRLLDYEADIIDNSFVMLLKALLQAGVHSVACAGFDGYSENGGNYFNEQMEYWFARRKAEELNNYVKQYLRSVENKMKVLFVTDSVYCEQ